MGATSGMNLIRIGPLLVVIRTKYLCAGSKVATPGFGTDVFQVGLDLSTAAFWIISSIIFTALSSLPGLDSAAAENEDPSVTASPAARTAASAMRRFFMPTSRVLDVANAGPRGPGRS